MGTLRVRDIMTSDVCSFEADTPLTEAAAILTDQQISVAPVVEGGRIVGVVSKSDIVAALGRPAVTVRDVMTHVIYAVRPLDPVMSAVRLMVMQNVHRVIVVRDEGRLAGVISSMDVMSAQEHGERFDDEPTGPAARERHAEPAIAVGYVDLRALEIDG